VTTATTSAPESKGTPTAQPAKARRASWGDLALDNIVWLLLVVFVIIATVLNPFFLSVANFQNVLVQTTTLGFVSVAIALSMLLGEIDLSVVGTLGFTGAVGALLMEKGLSGTLAILVVVGLGALIGLINGICIAKLRMTSLIETLAMGLVLGGGVLALTKGRTITISDTSYTWLGQGQIFGWPTMPIALIALFLAIGLVLHRTPWGRKIYATGGNQRAAYAAGINTDRLIIGTFVLGGFLGGCAGWLATSYLSGVNSTMGSDLLLYAVAAPVIGGVSLTGGRGRVLGILGGVLLLTVVQVGLQLTNIDAYYVSIAGGFMIFLAVVVDAIRVRRRQARH
jgi:simple sugar transport system permease protein